MLTPLSWHLCLELLINSVYIVYVKDSCVNLIMSRPTIHIVKYPLSLSNFILSSSPSLSPPPSPPFLLASDDS